MYLKEYRPPDDRVNRTELHFELFEDHALVTARLHLLRDPAVIDETPLELQGQELELLALAVDGEPLSPGDYEVDTESLRIPGLPQQCVVQCTTRIRPQDNTSLEGLYKSRTMFCTQCEAEGFRKINYYLDRPDLM